MQKLLLCVLMVFCSGCAKDHTKPPANLDFVSVNRGTALLYDVRFDSDVDVLDLFDRGEGKGMASATLECALAEDEDFSVDKFIRFSATGSIEPEGNDGGHAKYSYLSSAFMSEVSNGGGSRRDLSATELNHLMSNKQQIPCKVVVTAYGYKPYYSNTLYIPVADLLREINKPR
ncbi:hypothetical protein J3Q09_09670 [Pseudomonas sp. R4-83]|uniref:hypothetical protein n=1 Tax=unclassified Pseudomonas TaxID=196821 RepID=UPI003DA9C118